MKSLVNRSKERETDSQLDSRYSHMSKNPFSMQEGYFNQRSQKPRPRISQPLDRNFQQTFKTRDGNPVMQAQQAPSEIQTNHDNGSESELEKQVVKIKQALLDMKASSAVVAEPKKQVAHTPKRIDYGHCKTIAFFE